MRKCVNTILSIAGITEIPRFTDGFFALCYRKAEKEFIRNYPSSNFESTNEHYHQVIRSATGTMLLHLLVTLSQTCCPEQKERLERFLRTQFSS